MPALGHGLLRAPFKEMRSNASATSVLGNSTSGQLRLFALRYIFVVSNTNVNSNALQNRLPREQSDFFLRSGCGAVVPRNFIPVVRACPWSFLCTCIVNAIQNMWRAHSTQATSVWLLSLQISEAVSQRHSRWVDSTGDIKTGEHLARSSNAFSIEQPALKQIFRELASK